WTFASSADGGRHWQELPGALTTWHRVYTVLGVPRFGAVTGVQHGGPWVEVAEYAHTWAAALGVDRTTPEGVTAAIVKGFGGQVGGIATAIEGVRYDTTTIGGDSGASHYYTVGWHTVQLSRLLDGHANGAYVNCSDC